MDKKQTDIYYVIRCIKQLDVLLIQIDRRSNRPIGGTTKNLNQVNTY